MLIFSKLILFPEWLSLDLDEFVHETSCVQIRDVIRSVGPPAWDLLKMSSVISGQISDLRTSGKDQ